MTIDGNVVVNDENSRSTNNGYGENNSPPVQLEQQSMAKYRCSNRKPESIRFKTIHPHCFDCVQPLKCVRKPTFYQTILSNEEVYSMILDVNYYDYESNRNVFDDDNVQYCPVIRCTNIDCNVITHFCKLQEHYLLCQYQKISCINSTYGCPYLVLRGNLSTHLQHCPANVVHCSAEWNRWPLHTTEKSPQAQVFCSPHSLDIRNLDVALALRDQRMLKQLWSASRQMKRIMRGCLSTHPAVPIKPYIGIRTYREYTTTINGQMMEDGTLGSVTMHCANIDEEKYLNYAARLVEIAYRESLVEILKRTANYYRRIYYEKSIADCHQSRKKSNSICQMLLSDQRMAKNMNSNFLTPLSSGCSLPSSSSINLPILTDSDRFFLTHVDESIPSIPANPQPPPPPPVPKCNALSLEISIRCFAFFQPKPRAMYTFRCGLDFRKDELGSHYRDIHSDIHGGLDGWIEHRCPLFQYGCNFVHRRLSPHSPFDCNDPVKTIVYNEHLEAFACSAINSIHDDHQYCDHSPSSPSISFESGELMDFEPQRTRTNSGSSSLASMVDCSYTNKRVPSSTYSLLSNSSSPLLLSPSTSTNPSTPSSICCLSSVPSLNDFPFEIQQHICSFLDGYSLNNLSFTSHRLRSVVQSFLKKKGYVVLQWKRYETEKGKYQWKVAYKRWLFSTSIAPIKGWTLDPTNVMAQHLQVCPFNERNVQTKPFCYVSTLPIQEWKFARKPNQNSGSRKSSK